MGGSARLRVAPCAMRIEAARGYLLICWGTGPHARPASGQERFLKRQLSLPVSMISQ